MVAHVLDIVLRSTTHARCSTVLFLSGSLPRRMCAEGTVSPLR